MDKKSLANIKKLLIQKKAELLNKTHFTKSSIDSKTNEEVGDEIDTAVQNVERELIFELAANDNITLQEIKDAIGKIEKNVYGFCECCAKPINKERLEAIPWGRYCIKCQEEAEKPKKYQG
ncbi:MAG: TraR/DksA family transcriptional regulator [Elusimicrobiota bacterium]|jgi:DnaK suppressor protein|nr:TraR/DksA family transcriptional regulator [Elusimicrobiota bacterium]